MKKSTWRCKIKNGKLLLDDREMFDLYLQGVGNADKLEIVLQNEHKDKSNSQLGYYFSVIIPAFSEATGYEKYEADAVLKRMFLTRNRGEENEYIESKARLSSEEMSEYIESCIRFLISNGIYVETRK